MGRGRPTLLTPEIFLRLGTVPDSKLAREYDVSMGSVIGWRKRFAIPSCRDQTLNPSLLVETAIERELKKLEWLASRGEEREVGGTKSCPKCEEVKSISSGFGYRIVGGKQTAQSWCNTCRSARTPKEIAADRKLRMRARLNAKYPDLLTLLESYTQSDDATAEMYGISRQRIQQIRAQLDLSSATEVQRREFEREVEHLLGTRPDQEIADLTGYLVGKIQRFRLDRGILPQSDLRDILEPHLDRLGKVSDNQLGRELGIAPQAVGRHRISRGIPSSAPSGRVRKYDYDEIRRLHAEGHSDREISRRLDAPYTVINGIRRDKLGLPVNKRKKKTSP